MDATVFRVTKEYFREFRDNESFVPYGRLLATKKAWTTPSQIKVGQPHPWGYGSSIEDTVLHAGHLLCALLTAQEAKPNQFLETSLREMFSALKYIYSLTPVPGLVPRGPHPDDRTAVYDDSSMDQHTTFIISLARWAQSDLATNEDKDYIRRTLNEVGERLERNGFCIMRADGVTQSHIGFAWTGMVHEQASIILPALRALAVGTNNPHWAECYDRFSDEKGGLRWKLLAPSDSIKINAHPIYANQNCFRLESLYRFELEPRRRDVTKAILAHATHLQLGRDYPNEFLKGVVKCDWPGLARECNWDGPVLHGSMDAVKRFSSRFQDFPDSKMRDNAILAHVRFPLGGFHMALLSEDATLIDLGRRGVASLLDTVDVDRIHNGETRYLFAVTSLLMYAAQYSRP